MLAYAKINLTLEILARRSDGYHALRSVMLPIGLADELTFTRGERFAFHCNPPALQTDNLVVRAFELIGLTSAPIVTTLRKRVPVGAGLGGGSSDAAAVLRAAIDGHFGPVAPRDWVADARALGSDVPFFLVGTGALVEGSGERVTALGALPPWWVVLLVPGVAVSTPDAFRRLAAVRERLRPSTRARSDSASLRALVAVQRGDYEQAVSAAINDFEPLVGDVYPEVAAALDAFRAANAPHAMLSGSGGTCFSLCPDEAAARSLQTRLDVPAGARLHVVPLAPAPAWRAVTPP